MSDMLSDTLSDILSDANRIPGACQMKIKKSYRIEEELVAELEKYANEKGISAAEAIGIAIQNIRGVSDTVSDTVSDNCPTPHAVDSTVDALVRQIEIVNIQLEKKDEQLAALGAALVAAQESNKALSANAAMHTAADKRDDLSLETAGQNQERKTRWQRLKEAWRG